MKTKKSNYVIAVVISLVLILSFSCEMFTTSQLTFAKRDLSDSLKDLSKDELLDIATNPDLRGDPEATKQVLKLIGNIDLSETDVSAEQGNNILELATDAMLPMSAISSIADSLMGDENSNNDPDVADIVTSIVKNVPKVDTKAVQGILNNEDYLKDEDTDLETVVMASVAVVACSLSNTDLNDTQVNKVVEDLSKGIEDLTTANPNATSDEINVKIDEILSANGAGDVATSVQAAFNALNIIKDNPKFGETEIVGTKLEDLIGGLFGNSNSNGSI